MPMIIIPAIDIRNGKCVRLFQGDYDQETIYSDDPLEMALKWKSLGAQIVHVVDLDGAKDGSPINMGIISKIAEEVQIEIGGGIRNIDTIQKYLDAGVYRVVLGTIILEDFDLAKEIFERFNNKVVVGLDTKNGILMKKGWVIESGFGVFETAKKLEELGAKRIIYTDILEVVRKVAKEVFIPFTVGGGISRVGQVREILFAGAEKVSLNSSAVKNPQLITDAANDFGSQCIVLAIDAKKVGSSWKVFIKGGREETDLDVLDWAIKGVKLGAGEILLTSMDKDGTKSGFDLELTMAVSESVNVSVIASGGAGNESDFLDVFNQGKADAALAASLFHFGELKIKDLKKYLRKNNIEIRS